MDIVAELTLDGTIPLLGIAFVCFASMVAGFVDSIAGGGGFITFPAYLIAGVPIHATIATNKLSSTMGTTIATIKYLMNGYVLLWLVLPSIVCAAVGSFVGSNLSMLANETVIRWLMLAVIPFAAVFTLKKDSFTRFKQAYGRKKTILITSAIALAMGFYDGFYGPGTGTFLMILLAGIARLDVQHCAGTTKVINLTTNITALAVFLINGQVYLLLGIVCGIFNIIGNYIGATLFTDKGAKVVRPLIIVVLIIFTVRIICELAGIV